MAEGGEEAAQPRPKQMSLLGMVVRGLIFYYVFAAMSKSAKKGSETPAQAQLDAEGNQVATRSQGQPLFFPIFQKGDLVVRTLRTKPLHISNLVPSAQFLIGNFGLATSVQSVSLHQLRFLPQDRLGFKMPQPKS
jgi:hypothetical protein